MTSDKDDDDDDVREIERAERAPAEDGAPLEGEVVHDRKS